MEHANSYAYGLWSLVIINSAIFILFAYSFTKFKTKTDWRSWGGFSAFVIAYFTEMYGFSLSIYFLSGWPKYYPGVNFYSHESGHLLHTLFGLRGNPHFDPFHILSNTLIVVGFIIIASDVWSTLYKAQRQHGLAISGLYAKVRHPQYDGFILIMIGFLLQWPTILTLIMFPILVYMYVKLAQSEEKEVIKEFGEKYKRYAEVTPVFIHHIFEQKSFKKGDVS